MIKTSNRWGEVEQDVILTLRSYRPRLAKLNASKAVINAAFPSAPIANYEVTGGTPGQGTNRTECNVHSFLDMRDQMWRDVARQEEEIRAIYEWINTLPPDEYTVINRRYILNQNMQKIECDTCWSVRSCWRLHYHGLKHLAESWHDLAHKLK